MKVTVNGGTWMSSDEVKGFNINVNDVIRKVRAEGAAVEDNAKVAVFISDDKNEICFAVEGVNDFIFFEDVCFTPDNYEETCVAVAQALELC